MKFPTVLALALAASPAAHAQASCQDIKSLVDLAFEDFEPIKGRPTAYDGRAYVASLLLPRADECVVRDASNVIYECSWTFDSIDTLTAAHERIMATARACLSDWELVPEKKNIRGAGDIEVTTFGAALRGNGATEPVSVRSWGVETLQPGASMRALRFSVSLKAASRKVA